jgi:hypothetical protein
LKIWQPSVAASQQSRNKADKYVAQISQSLVDPRSVFLDLSIEIERRVRKLAVSHEIPKQLGLKQLIDELMRRQIITDTWLYNALNFFRQRRNQMVHEGKTEQIQSAIDIGRTILNELPK